MSILPVHKDTEHLISQKQQETQISPFFLSLFISVTDVGENCLGNLAIAQLAGSGFLALTEESVIF